MIDVRKYETSLREEFMIVHEYLKFSMDDILRMPVYDRKFYINQYRKIQARRAEAMGSR